MITKPLFFERNRVGRVYTGGKLFHGFFGDKPEDNFLPEEWIASNVKAINKVQLSEKEGVSKIKDEDVYFDDLLNKYPKEMLGACGKYRILVKMLDSAIRLPAQTHPDKAFSKKYFNSEYGKTENWLIVDTRPGAGIYFGFKEGVTEEMFVKAIEEGKTDKDAMERLMEYKPVEKGDVYLIPAKEIHAIGAGCLILEVQEPTDFTIQPEYWCGDYELNEQEMYIGLSKETAVSCFNVGKAPDTKIIPEIVSENDGVKYEKIITEKHTDCFVINRITLADGNFVPNIKDSYGVYIITDGEGEITGADYKKNIKKGDYFFMPNCAMDKFEIKGNLEIIECY